MSYVGIGTAVGQVIDVPIVLRSLAASLASVSAVDLLIPYDLGLLSMLDCGTNYKEYGRVVNSYALAWWQGNRRPGLGAILSGTTLEECLKHHRVQLLRTTEGDPIPKIPIIPILPLQLPRPSDASESPRTGAGAGELLGTGTGADDECPHCTNYRLLAADLLNEIRSIKNLNSGMIKTTANELDIGSRRTSGFYTVHEKALWKEMGSQSVEIGNLKTTGRGRTGKLSQQIRENAQEALERLKDMPAGSHKWTWGETLTRDDILSLRRVRNQRIHTGYETSLEVGNLPGVFSDAGTAPTGTARYSVLPADAHPRLPFTSLRYPKKLKSYALNPSSRSNSPPTHVDVAGAGVLFSANVEGFDDDLPAASPSTSKLTNLAQRWVNMESDTE